MLDTCAPQPPPTPGKDSVTDALIDDLKRRREGGLKKYGTELQTWNGRSFLVDAYQELLDAALYVRGVLMEDQDRRAATEKIRHAVKTLLLVHKAAPKVRDWVREALLEIDDALKLLEPKAPEFQRDPPPSPSSPSAS